MRYTTESQLQKQLKCILKKCLYRLIIHGCVTIALNLHSIKRRGFKLKGPFYFCPMSISVQVTIRKSHSLELSMLKQASIFSITLVFFWRCL